MTRNKTGLMVELLDYEKLATACAGHGIAEPSFGSNAILRRVSDGQPVVISSEGVSSTKIEAGVAYLDTQAFDWQCLPIGELEACRTGESIDLADHVRTFGSRLDANVSSWSAWAKATR